MYPSILIYNRFLYFIPVTNKMYINSQAGGASREHRVDIWLIYLKPKSRLSHYF